MKFLLVTHHAPPHVGGVQALVDCEARALADLGHDVAWVAARAAGAGEVPEYPDQIRMISVAGLAHHGPGVRHRLSTV